jgi:hypothetical protein
VTADAHRLEYLCEHLRLALATDRRVIRVRNVAQPVIRNAYHVFDVSIRPSPPPPPGR